MSGLEGLLGLVTTLARYARWRDGCPDCGREDKVSNRRVPGSLYCWGCNRVWKRGEA